MIMHKKHAITYETINTTKSGIENILLAWNKAKFEWDIIQS
jgi:hypothetical protein